MKQALMNQQDMTVVLLNYHKNGTPFWNKIALAYLRDLNGKVSFIVGLQSPVSWQNLLSLIQTLPLPLPLC